MATRLALLFVFAGLVVGCNKTTPPTTEDAGAEVPAAPAAQPAVDLKSVDEKGFAESIAKHQGQVVLVDFWATWCGPCVEGFPHTVALHEKYKDQGLATISLSFDDPAEEAKVREFLAKQDAHFDHLISKYGTALVEAATAFDFEGSLPHYRLYDRSGKLRHSWSPENAKPEELEQKLQELLAEK